MLAGGIVAAFVGPWLGRIGGPLLEPRFTGAFLLLTVVSLVAAGLLTALRVPPAQQGFNPQAPKRHWSVIVKQPSYLVALFGAATGYGMMILAMTATPIAMVPHQHSLEAASSVIQFHTLGMFIPSFFTGSLIARFGAIRIMLAGLVLLIAHVLTTLTGAGFSSFAAALTIIGVGWNFLYIGDTTLLTSTYTPAEKSTAQAINDMTIFAVGLACSLSVGALLQGVGWSMLNMLLLPWMGVAGLALIWFAFRRPRAPLHAVA